VILQKLLYMKSDDLILSTFFSLHLIEKIGITTFVVLYIELMVNTVAQVNMQTQFMGS